MLRCNTLISKFVRKAGFDQIRIRPKISAPGRFLSPGRTFGASFSFGAARDDPFRDPVAFPDSMEMLVGPRSQSIRVVVAQGSNPAPQTEDLKI